MTEEYSFLVCAVVVTYYPDVPRLESLLEATSLIVDKTCIVDNTPSIDSSNIQVINWQKMNVEYLPLQNNFGLGYGFNKGIVWARENNFTHVLLLDQDSIPQEGMLTSLLEISIEIESLGILCAAVGSNHFDPRSGYKSSYQNQKYENKTLRALKLPQNCTPVQHLQSSGSLISLRALDVIGLMDEKLFIHHIDQEWCLRANAKGFHCFIASDALMEHLVGNDVVKVWIGYWRDVHIHSPFRHYFSFRNSLLLYKKKYVPWTWICIDVARLVFMFLFYSFFMSSRISHISMMTRGIADGINGRSGPFSR